MTLYICDKCGKGAEGREAMIDFRVRCTPGRGYKQFYDGKEFNHPPIDGFMLCPECAVRAVEFLMDGGKEE